MYLPEVTSITKREVNVSHEDGPWIADPLITISGWTSRVVISCRAEFVLSFSYTSLPRPLRNKDLD